MSNNTNNENTINRNQEKIIFLDYEMQGPKKGKMTPARRLAAVEAMQRYRPFDRPHSQVADAWLSVLRATNAVDKEEHPVGLTTVKTAVKKYYPTASDYRFMPEVDSDSGGDMLQMRGRRLCESMTEAVVKKENKGKSKTKRRKTKETESDVAEDEPETNSPSQTDNIAPSNDPVDTNRAEPSFSAVNQPFESLDRTMAIATEAHVSQHNLLQKMNHLMQQQLTAHTNMCDNLKQMTECYKEMNRVQAEAVERQNEINHQFMQAMLSSQQQFFGQLNTWMQHVNVGLSRLGQPPIVASTFPVAAPNMTPIHAPILAPAANPTVIPAAPAAPATSSATGPMMTVFSSNQTRTTQQRKRPKKQ
ncbi:hypothetical protein EDC96DRAFT_518426 [Choanephora cucurbitarum]|nr:hypothetical protein EDC96DRAFT_518426 [Choanephora cucurbitarum]